MMKGAVEALSSLTGAKNAGICAEEEEEEVVVEEEEEKEEPEEEEGAV